MKTNAPHLMNMTKKSLLIIPAILILHSVVLSFYSLNAGPSPYDSRGFNAVWPWFITLFLASFLIKKVKAKYWGISVYALVLAVLPRALIATIPDYTYHLVAATLILNCISASALLASIRYDSFDLSLWKINEASRSSYLVIAICVVIMMGIFLYFGRG
jgi:hypothetical protein